MPVRVLPVDRAAGERTLERLQVTTRSVLGALALECGGVLVDHGWLRILGGGGGGGRGGHGIPGLGSANGLGDPGDDPSPPGHLLVAWDVLGGRFAIDGGGLGVAPGRVCYFAPDALRWESLDVGHGEFVHAMIGGGVTQFYDGMRWPGREADCDSLGVGEGFALWPPPFSVEGCDLALVSRRAVPIAELFAFYDDAADQLG